MTYSSALFGGDREPLARGRAAREVRPAARARSRCAAPSRILEIGCGWGGFAEVAARAGHHVTGVSLSDAQTAYARAAARSAAGLADRADLRVQDYRDVRGAFDAVASIEMIEAVGERWWPTYFRALRDALVPGGRAAIQAITIADERFERYRTQSDFIQQYIFPGGMLAVADAARRRSGRGAGLRLVERARVRPRLCGDAAPLARGVRRARGRDPAQGFDERFIRCWRFYLAYCAAGFDSATTDVAHYVFVREG